MRTNGYRMIVAGGRDFSDEELLNTTLDALRAELGDIEIVSGHARGADQLAESYAKKHMIPLKTFPAEWRTYGRGAGPIRNQAMLAYIMDGNPVVTVFWDGHSKGTKNMIDQARNAGVDCRVIMYPLNLKQE